MAATFDPSLDTAKDRLRLRVFDSSPVDGDGNLTDPLLQDETYEAMLAAYGDDEDLAYAALFPAAHAAAAAQMTRYQSGNTTEEYGNRLKAFEAQVSANAVSSGPPALQTATIADSGTGERLSEYAPNWRGIDDPAVVE